ncbi:GntR family transcriptional regulator [Amycolatopsis eburnea]|uniref:GntR family transcriptional regulator n=1 Tax=Amycolatopsis eburnea TaxID=2267691 RepID=A0A3R9E6G1_9PSEU|nr:GntR family transcriptional regulator [Amycolatopsis eburnea]RSD21760.1 GntR family transcriptional regulator [Amycolatopsis eburnea]
MVDRTSGVPAFRQVAADLRRKIDAGEYAPGAKLPSERELIETYGVSRPTVREAVNLLRSEGVVDVEHGRGVFVRPPSNIHRLARARLSRDARGRNEGAFLAEAKATGFSASSNVKVRFERADERAAEFLRLDVGTELTVRDRVMRADGLVAQLAVSRLPRELTRGTAIEKVATGDGGTYARLEEAGHVIGSFAEHVGARMPTPDEVTLLQLAVGVPVLTITRVAYGTEGRPLEMNDIVLPASLYQLSYEWPAD